MTVDTTPAAVDTTPAPVDTTPAAVVDSVKAKAMPFVRVVHFALDKSELSAESRKVLDEIVTILAKHDKAVVMLEGHTDPRGGSTYNLRLSERRAKAVEEYLLSAQVRASRIEARARGFTQRQTSGTTTLDFAIDRRVVLRFLTEDNHVMTVGEVEAVDENRDLQIEAPAPRRGNGSSRGGARSSASRGGGQ
jgi:outer membrane protein OmpA-like peptidoglycan-associated protein